MSAYAFITRISFLAALVLASAIGAGWKWDLVPH
jgi:hypothetical protein